MAEVLHASLTPNVVSAGETLEVEFDSIKPWKDASDVVVRIFEIDDASPFEPQPGKGKLVVTFRGKLSDNQFELTPAPSGKTNPEIPTVPGSPPVVKIKIGNTTTDVPLPDKTEEQGVFELRLQVEVIKPKAKKYTNGTKVLVRCFDHFRVKKIPRPVVAFITGAPDASYFTGATEFWKLNADVVIARQGMSLQEILDMLTKEHDKYGDWGQINIVAHGRAHLIAIKLFRQSSEGVHTDKIGDEIDRCANAKPPDSLPVPGGIDSDTQIVFRACNAGQDQELIDALNKDVFGGMGKLFIPKFPQVYHYEQPPGGKMTADEWFEESLSFDTRTTTAPTGTDLQSGLEGAWNALVSPGKGGRKEDEIPTFTENHDWLETIPFTIPAEREKEMTNPDGSPMSDEELLKRLRTEWQSRHKLEENSATSKTKESRWLISVKSKNTTKKTGLPREFFLRVQAGTASPMFQEYPGGEASLGSTAATNVWVVNAKGVSARHFDLEFINSAASRPLRVKVIDLNSGEDTVVGRTTLNNGASKVFDLPITIEFGQAQLEVREANKPVDLVFECQRHHVDRRRKLMTFDATKSYGNRTKVEQPTVGNPKHFGRSS